VLEGESQRHGRRTTDVPLYVDHGKGVKGLTADAVAYARRKDVEVQKEYGVAYHRYWFNEDTARLFASSRPLTKMWP